MSAHGFVASWDGISLSVAGYGQPDDTDSDILTRITRFDTESACDCPVVEPEVIDASFSALILPAEDILVRPFSLPLKSEKHLDKEILRQELADSLGEGCDNWWLSWCACSDDNGVSGLLFGLSESSRSKLSEQDAWNRCPVITVDGWHRLNSQFQEATAEECGELNGCAVLDADTDGLFVGFRQSSGSWSGMRRINSEGRDNSGLAEDIHRSLLAMGYEPEGDAVLGRLSPELAKLLIEKGLKWDGETTSDLLARPEANLLAYRKSRVGNAMNFRHGKWKVHTTTGGSIRVWKPSLMLGAVLLLTILTGGWYKLNSLENRIEMYQQGIIEAFRRGLPNESVMLDPLAQLRAAGQPGNAVSTKSLLHDLQVLDRVKKEVKGWGLGELSLSGDVVKLSGNSPDFALLNRIQERLSSSLSRDVEMVNTELNNDQVKFSIEWKLP